MILLDINYSTTDTPTQETPPVATSLMSTTSSASRTKSLRNFSFALIGLCVHIMHLTIEWFFVIICKIFYSLFSRFAQTFLSRLAQLQRYKVSSKLYRCIYSIQRLLNCTKSEFNGHEDCVAMLSDDQRFKGRICWHLQHSICILPVPG